MNAMAPTMIKKTGIPTPRPTAMPVCEEFFFSGRVVFVGGDVGVVVIEVGSVLVVEVGGWEYGVGVEEVEVVAPRVAAILTPRPSLQHVL
jgi:hypothetical protein